MKHRTLQGERLVTLTYPTLHIVVILSLLPSARDFVQYMRNYIEAFSKKFSQKYGKKISLKIANLRDRNIL